MWEGIEFRHLRVFLTLAEELHFGRTAERLHLTPSRVSQTLRELERRLGAQLVHRTSRRVELTSRGAAFLREARPAYDALSEALHRARAAAGTVQGALRLGLCSGPAGGPHLMRVVAAFESCHPGARVEVSQVSWDDPLAPLRASEVDLLASWLPLEQPDLVVGPVLAQHPRVLAVAPHHALATRERVSIEELAGERIARFSDWPRELVDSVWPKLTPTGQPLTAVNVPPGERTPLGFLTRVSRGEFVHITVATAAPSLDIAYVPVDGLPPLRSALVWRERSSDLRRREFVRIAHEMLSAPA